jgi:hypothetical protein
LEWKNFTVTIKLGYSDHSYKEVTFVTKEYK